MTTEGPFVGALEADTSVPPWLQGTTGIAYLGAMDVAFSAVWWKSAQAARIHMPGLGDPSQLPLLGNDRVLVQGLNESNGAFVSRLTNAYFTWQLAGNAWSELQQIFPQIYPNTPQTPGVRIVTDEQQWWYYPDGNAIVATNVLVPPMFVRTVASSWNWDNGADLVAFITLPVNRWWLVIDSDPAGVNDWCHQWTGMDTAGAGYGYVITAGQYLPAVVSTHTPALGGAPNSSMGFVDVAPGFWTGMRAILETWRSANSWCRDIVVTFTSTGMLPDNLADGVLNPNGGWGYGYLIGATGQYGSTFFSTSEVVPGTPYCWPPGSANDVDQSATFGYRIVQGQYLPA